jgi:hypothetical protein
MVPHLSRRNLGGLAVLIAGVASLIAVLVYRLGLWPEPAEVAELQQAQHVASVEAPDRPWRTDRRIIHILDYHWTPRELHEGPEPYERHLADVAAVQGEQMPLLRHLATRYGLKAVYLEGLTVETVPAYREKVAALKTAAEQVAVSVGAPGRLLMAGHLDEVRPLDDAEALAAADPRKADAATLKARDDAIVKNALAGGEPVVVVLLGGGHDLAASVRAADPNCGYIRVTTKKVGELPKGP